jgi:hypothetical protein
MQAKIKKSFLCRQVREFQIDSQAARFYIPQAGDVAVFRVMKIGKHIRMQCEDGLNRLILPGDLIMCAFGNRYATNQIEGYVPDRILGEYHLLAQGGVAGEVRSMYKPLEEVGPTTLQLLGYVKNEQGNIINTKYLGHKKQKFQGKKPFESQVILSLGTSMDSGKTTSAAYLCRGLSRSGKKTAYMKLTGTAFSKDADLANDCGADTTIDFSSVGFPSTYLCDEMELLDLYATLLHRLQSRHPEVIVIEIADGLLQRETAMLLCSKAFLDTVDGVIFSAGDSMGALYGLDYLSRLHIQPYALCGLFTMSPLLIQEVQVYTQTPVLNLQMLEQPEVARLVAAHNLTDMGTSARTAAAVA